MREVDRVLTMISWSANLDAFHEVMLKVSAAAERMAQSWVETMIPFGRWGFGHSRPAVFADDVLDAMRRQGFADGGEMIEGEFKVLGESVIVAADYSAIERRLLAHYAAPTSLADLIGRRFTFNTNEPLDLREVLDPWDPKAGDGPDEGGS